MANKAVHDPQWFPRVCSLLNDEIKAEKEINEEEYFIKSMIFDSETFPAKLRHSEVEKLCNVVVSIKYNLDISESNVYNNDRDAKKSLVKNLKTTKFNVIEAKPTITLFEEMSTRETVESIKSCNTLFLCKYLHIELPGKIRNLQKTKLLLHKALETLKDNDILKYITISYNGVHCSIDEEEFAFELMIFRRKISQIFDTKRAIATTFLYKVRNLSYYTAMRKMSRFTPANPDHRVLLWCE